MDAFSIATLFLFVCLGSLAGFLAGLLGIGGGIILVPLFLWAFDASSFSPEILVHTAFGTSLAIIVPTALSSALGHRKRGNVVRHQVAWLCLGGILGALCGAWLASLLDGNWLKLMFGVMQIFIALQLLIFHPRLPPESREKVPPLPLVLVGMAGGAFSAFFGVGGGVVAVPLMVILLGFPIHLAVGNSSAMIVVSASAGALSYTFHGWGLLSLPPFSVAMLEYV